MVLPNRLARPALALCLAACLSGCGESEPAAPPPVEVVVAPVVQRDVAGTSAWIGTTEGAVDAEIRAQASGYLVAREYEEGTLVREGEVMFRIDPRRHQAALEQARGDAAGAPCPARRRRFTPLVARAVSRRSSTTRSAPARARPA
jgi:membrane fusion protein (multidrug efflux system)